MAIKSWSTTDADNDDADLSNNIDWRENQAPSTVNNSARAMMTSLKNWWDDILEGTYFIAAANVSVTSNAYTLTTTQGIGSLKAGIRICFIAKENNTDAVTVNPDSLGATAVKSHGDPLASGAISNGDVVILVHDGTDFELVYPRRHTSVDFTMVNDDAGAGAGPFLTFLRNSASPAVNDVLGEIDFKGKDSAGNTETYASLLSLILDETTTTEDGLFRILTKQAGSTLPVANFALGFYMHNATGGDQGADTINASTYYADGNQLAKIIEVETLTASASATLDFETIPTGTTRLEIRFSLVPATDDVNLFIRLKFGGAFKSGATDYLWTYGGTGGSLASEIEIGDADTGQAVGSGTDEFADGVLFIENPLGTSLQKYVQTDIAFAGADTTLRRVSGMGKYRGTGATGALQGVQLLFESGNIASGSATLYAWL